MENILNASCVIGSRFTHHDRDLNAASNLQRLVTATTLPEASPVSNGWCCDHKDEKVTLVRDDSEKESGQEKKGTQLRIS